MVNEGGSITLMYKVSAYWEHCIFSVLSSEADGSSDNGKRTVCDLEWKRSQWNVTKNSCDPRATFVGSYNQVRSLLCYLVGFFRPSICQRAKLLLTLKPHSARHFEPTRPLPASFGLYPTPT